MNRSKLLLGSIIECAVALCLSTLSANGQTGPGQVSEGLRVWLCAGTGFTAVDGEPVSIWCDQSGQGNDAVFNELNSYGELPPLFVAANPGARNQPTVHFANQNALELDLTWLAGSDYTIFVANSRDRYGLANFYIAGDLQAQNQNLVLGYERVDLLRQAHFNNDLDALVEPYVGTPIWELDTFRFAQTEGRDLYQDGQLLASDDNPTPLISNPGTTLGHFRAYGNAFWFQGDLAEVVVYDRALSWEEKLRVEADLAGRYGRPLRLEDYVSPSSQWRTHGAYVSTHAHVVDIFVAAGVMTPAEGEEAQSEAARSNVGR